MEMYEGEPFTFFGPVRAAIQVHRIVQMRAGIQLELRTPSMCCAMQGDMLVFGKDNWLVVQSLTPGREPVEIKHNDPVVCCALEQRTLVAGHKNSVVVRDLETMTERQTYIHHNRVQCCSLQRGKLAVGDDKGVALYELDDKAQSQPTSRFKHEKAVKCCAIDEPYLVAGDFASELVVRHLGTGEKQIHRHGGKIYCCAVSVASNRLVAGDFERNLIVRDLESGYVLHSFEHESSVWVCALQGSTLVAGDDNNRVVVRDLKTGATVRRHTNDERLSCMALDSSGERMVFGDENHLTVLYLDIGDVLYVHEHGSNVWCSAADTLTNRLVVGTDSNELTVYELRTGRPLRTISQKNSVRCCALEGTTVASGGFDKQLLLHDVETGDPLGSFEHDGAVRCVAFEGRIVAAGDANRELIVRRLGHTSEPVAELHRFQHDGQVECIALGGGRLVSGDFAKMLIVRMLDTGEVEHSFKHQARIWCCELVGNRLIAGDHARKLVVRALDTGNTIYTLSHHDVVFCCAMRGSLLVAGDMTCQLTVYDLDNDGAIVASFLNPGTVRTCSFTGNTLTSAGHGGAVIVRDLGDFFDPLPDEVSFENVVTLQHRPWLAHRRDTGGIGDTVLHRVAKLQPQARAEQALELCLKPFGAGVANGIPLCAINNSDDPPQTPLDLAIGPCRSRKNTAMLLRAYLNHPDGGILGAEAVTQSLPNLVATFPKLAAYALGSRAVREVNTVQISSVGLRLPERKYKVHEHIRVPQLWGDKDGLDERSGVQAVTVKSRVLIYRDFLSANGPFNSLVASRNLGVFSTEAVNWAVEYKWNKFGFASHTIDFSLYLVALICFICGQLALVVQRNGARELGGDAVPKDGLVDVSTGLLYVTTTFCSMVLFVEVLQGASSRCLSSSGRDPKESERAAHPPYQVHGRMRYTVHPGILINVTIHAMLIVASIATIQHDSEPRGRSWVSCVSGWAAILATLNVFTFLRPYKWSGPLCRMLIEIIKDIRPFLVFLLIVLVGFSTGFAVMMPGTTAFNVPVVFLASFEMMIGNYDTEYFASSGDDPTLTTAAVLAFVLYMLFVLIIMLNLLIAIMSSSYERVSANIEAFGQLERAETLAAMDARVKVVANMIFGIDRVATWEWFPRGYLHALQPEIGGEVTDATHSDGEDEM